MFKNANNSTKQGNIGEAMAILHYTKMGYGVSKTSFDSEKYDLIVDYGKSLRRVQVKTTKFKSNSGVYRVNLKTCGGNRSCNTIRNVQDDDYDELFVLCENGDYYIIPLTSDMPRTSINLGDAYRKYKI